jgi:hypothetical protein
MLDALDIILDGVILQLQNAHFNSCQCCHIATCAIPKNDILTDIMEVKTI